MSHKSKPPLTAKQILNKIRNRGFFRCPKNLRSVNPGSFLVARIEEDSNNPEKLNLLTVREGDWKAQKDSAFLRMVEGTTTSNAKSTALFVKGKDIFAFIPPEMAKSQHIEAGAKVLAWILFDYQKSKDTWSWRCISILK